MRSFKEIKRNYGFGDEDARRLASLNGLMSEHADRAMHSIHSWILQARETAQFFDEEKRKTHVFGSQKKWFLDLFSGVYDNSYYERLIRIGQAHVRASVDAHYMARAVNLIRTFTVEIINHSADDCEERSALLVSLDKILDINLDVITSAYIEEEIKAYSSAYRVKNKLIKLTERFSEMTNLLLVLALIGLTVGAGALFVIDLRKIFVGDLYHGIITALGSLLILWVMIELMNTEISHLKGGKFRINVFIGVALVAFIRDTLIMTLKHEQMEKQYYFIALIFILGVVFWLVTRAEERSK